MHDVVSPKKEYLSLYCLKALCALMVVIIHLGIYEKESIMFILRCAVPCFFAISGYFFYSGTKEKEIHRAWRIVGKTIPLLLYLIIVYSLYPFNINGERTLCSMLFGAPVSIPFWYLAALWQAFLILALVRFSCSRMWVVFAIAPILQFLYSSYCLPCVTDTKDFIAYHLPFFAVTYIGGGYLVAQYKIAEKMKTSWMLLSVGCLFVAEYFLCLYVSQPSEIFGFAKVILCYLYTCSAALMVALCIRNDGAQIKILAWIGKYHSGNIYFYHSLLPRFMNRFLGTAFMSDIEPVLSFVVYLICIPLSMSVNKAWRFIKSTYGKVHSAA